MSGRFITLLAIGLTATAVVAVSATKPGRVVAAQGSRVCTWQVAPAEDPHRALFDRFTSVVVVNGHQAWATGDFFTGEEGGRSGAFIERWDGRSWRLVDAPVPPGWDLWSVSASGRADVWAAGAAEYGGQLIEHWDGKRWERVTAPRVRGGLPFAIASLAPDDVWAVGVAKTARGLRTLTEHWDGTRWTVVPSPNPASAARGRFAILLAVTATSSTDVWAAGYRGRTGSNISRTLIEHWDGRRWTIIPSPNTRAPNGVVNNILFSISSARKDDVWAVGSWGGGRGIRGQGRPRSCVPLGWEPLVPNHHADRTLPALLGGGARRAGVGRRRPGRRAPPATIDPPLGRRSLCCGRRVPGVRPRLYLRRPVGKEPLGGRVERHEATRRTLRPVGRRTSCRAVVARMLRRKSNPKPSERNLPLCRSTRSARVGDHGDDEAVDLVRLLDLPNLPVPGRIDVSGGQKGYGTLAPTGDSEKTASGRRFDRGTSLELHRADGQTMAEYSIILAVITPAIVLTISLLSDRIAGLFTALPSLIP